jgi:DNA-directed RNA polymerase subunit RPC12/RpoP
LKKTVIPGTTPAACDPDALYLKAERYVQHMSALDSDDWEYLLWSSLSLELLARAALANISPALLAETDKSWSSLYHALGFTPTEEKFAPKSIAISEVFRRLSAILPDFAKEHENFGIQHTGRRNAELHSGEPAFDGIKGSTWQPRFYEICKILLASMGMTLEDFVGSDEAKVAQQLIAAAADDSAKAVKGEVEAHKKVWLAKTEQERTTLATQAAIWATRQAGHRIDCPACASRALVMGEPVSAPVQRLSDGEITETQEYLPNHFECIACGLKIAGLSRLTVVGLSDRYKKTQVYDAAEYYAPEDEYAGYDDDNNEY